MRYYSGTMHSPTNKEEISNMISYTTVQNFAQCLHWPQTRPSIVTERTHSSSFAISITTKWKWDSFYLEFYMHLMYTVHSASLIAILLLLSRAHSHNKTKQQKQVNRYNHRFMLWLLYWLELLCLYEQNHSFRSLHGFHEGWKITKCS